MHQHLVQNLIKEGVITGTAIALDSCPIVAPLRENNLKTSMAKRFDKTRKPLGDPDAGLGIMIYFPKPFKKEVKYFWGYRNHIINDITTELPMWETVKPANISEIKIAKPMIREAQSLFKIHFEVVVADAHFDVEDFLTFVINDLKSSPVIPRNPRNERPKGYHIKGNQIICEASIPMYRKGKMRNTRSNIFYCQYTCPVNYDPIIRKQYIMCPILHPKFLNGKGCNALIRLNPSIREKIDYGTKQFKEIYNSRTSVERIFSRLLAITMQYPTVRGLHAIQNHVTKAHIAVALVALTAHRTGQDDKIRFVKSFVPNFLCKTQKLVL